MFDIGMMEMFVIVVLAIIVVGPKDLPKLLRSIGQFIAKIRAMGQEFQSSLKQIADEVELDDVTRKLNEAGNIPLDESDVAPDIIPPIDPDESDVAPDITPPINSDESDVAPDIIPPINPDESDVAPDITPPINSGDTDDTGDTEKSGIDKPGANIS